MKKVVKQGELKQSQKSFTYYKEAMNCRDGIHQILHVGYGESCRYPSTRLQDGQKVTEGFVPQVNWIQVNSVLHAIYYAPNYACCLLLI